MAGKMTLYKLVVLGDGGVGKDSVNNPGGFHPLVGVIPQLTGLPAVSKPFCGDVRSYN